MTDWIWQRLNPTGCLRFRWCPEGLHLDNGGNSQFIVRHEDIARKGWEAAATEAFSGEWMKLNET